MKRKIISLTFALLICACSILTMYGCNGNMKTTDDFEYKTDISSVKKVLDTTSDDYKVLVNKDNKVDKSYAPKSLSSVRNEYTAEGKKIELEEKAALAAEAMISEMRAEGYDGIYITSGYRTYENQENLFLKYCAQEKEANPTLLDAEIQEKVLSYSAAPGSSEHQTGLCMDLITDEMEGLWNYGEETKNPYDKGFAETEDYTWLKNNAHKFGFILRYPDGKTDVTKYSYESWHYRFVGVPAATEIYEKGLTLEEYLDK